MKYGYARVSTEDQNPALQLAALKRAGCRKTFKDERTGATTKRPALLRCLKALQNGDTLIVWKLDRLARSLSTPGSSSRTASAARTWPTCSRWAALLCTGRLWREPHGFVVQPYSGREGLKWQMILAVPHARCSPVKGESITFGYAAAFLIDIACPCFTMTHHAYRQNRLHHPAP